MHETLRFEFVDGTAELVAHNSPRYRELVADGHSPVGSVPAGDGISDALQEYLDGRFGAAVDTTDAAVANVLDLPDGEANARLTATFVGKNANRPGIALGTAYPRPKAPHRIVWAEGDGATLYAVGNDKGLYKSTDRGATWVVRSTNYTYNLGARNLFLKLPNGNLLTYDDSVTPGQILRSTDDGANWSVVYTWRANTLPLGPQSWTRDQVTGNLYLGEYNVTDASNNDLRVVRSTDNGATWTTFHTFQGPATSDPSKIRHIHGVQWDPVGQRVYLTTGDPQDKCGIYRLNAAGNGIEPVLTRDYAGPKARAIGLMFFPNYIAWGSDEDAPNAHIMRMARSEIGKAQPEYETVIDTPGPAWWTIRAADDNSAWLVATDWENASTDYSARLYAVTDEGETVTELGHFPMQRQTLGTIAPVGLAENHGTTFWLSTFNVTGQTLKQWRASLIQQRLHRQLDTTIVPDPVVENGVWKTQDSGPIALTAGQSKLFGFDYSNRTRRTLYIYDAGCRNISGAVKVQVIRYGTGAVLLETTAGGFRRSGNESMPYYTSVVVDANVPIEFYIKENTGSATAEGVAYVTYGWGA